MQNHKKYPTPYSGYSRQIAALFIFLFLPALLAACGDRAPSSSQSANHTPQQSGCPASTGTASKGHTLYVGHATFASGPKFAAVTAVDVSDGKKIWQTTIAQSGTAPLQEPLQFLDGVVYAVHFLSIDMSVVVALDAKDGHIIWQYKTENQKQIIRLVVCHEVMYMDILTRHSTGNKRAIEARRLK